MPPDLGNSRPWYELPIWPGQTELLDCLLQPVGREVTADVVALDLLIGIDDMATVDIGRGVRHRQRPGLESRNSSTDPHRRAIPTPAQGKSKPLGAGDHEWQIEVEEVVSFDHVGVQLTQPLRDPL